METLKIWLKSLTGFIFVGAVIDAFLPDAATKKTVKTIMGIIMSILLISPFAGGMPEDLDIFAKSDEYIDYNDKISEMENLTKVQSENLYISSVKALVQRLAGEDTDVEVVLTENKELEKVVINKTGGALKQEIAAALKIAPSKIQMTE